MARIEDEGPLLPMHNLPSHISHQSSPESPPPYTPPIQSSLHPTSTPSNYYSRSSSPSPSSSSDKPHDHGLTHPTTSSRKNRRNACICMGVGIVMFVAIPAAVFGGIVAHARTDCVVQTSENSGTLGDGQKFC